MYVRTHAHAVGIHRGQGRGYGVCRAHLARDRSRTYGKSGRIDIAAQTLRTNMHKDMCITCLSHAHAHMHTHGTHVCMHMCMHTYMCRHVHVDTHAHTHRSVHPGWTRTSLIRSTRMCSRSRCTRYGYVHRGVCRHMCKHVCRHV